MTELEGEIRRFRQLFTRTLQTTPAHCGENKSLLSQTGRIRVKGPRTPISNL